ncbi:MAG TPA: glycosyltransferase, partial [Beijerinckiaceae bacterium]|nr:glycosyltransferase [Beijerinckiaceae bacterium]
MTQNPGRRILPIMVKGYPRLSETFIAQEILELERLGFEIEIWSLRRPTDQALHPMHRAIRARLKYLPEYLHDAPLRVLRAALAALFRPRLLKLVGVFLRDLARDFSPNRVRRFGQALVFARELDPALRHVHVHYLHTPASVARYAALLTGMSFSFSAHAKDIWTTQDWEKREKIADSVFGVTCTRGGVDELQRLCLPSDPGRVALVYHGLDLSRFPTPPDRPARRGDVPSDPLRLVAVGRAVAKKGFDDLLQALALLPADLHWRLVHIGSGELRSDLKALSENLGIASRVEFRGALPQEAVIAALREADLFVLPCKEGDAGDRDGLPNVILEAATQALPILSTNFAGVPEFVTDGVNGRLVPPRAPRALADA